MSRPDADALMARVLADPADPLRRLVFADYLDDLGTPAGAAWAEYIRLRAAAHTAESAVERELLREAATAVEPRIAARLAIPAGVFVPNLTAVLDLLPAANLTLLLADFTAPPPFDPQFCRQHRGLELGDRAGRTVIGVIDAATPDDRAAFESLHRTALFVRVPTADLEPAIQRAAAPRSLAVYRSPAETRPATLDEQLGTASATAMRRFVEQLVGQARERGATAIEITAYETHHWVRRIEGGKSVRWHQVGTDLGRELVRAARVLPSRRLGVRVRPRNSSFGDGVRIALLNLPRQPGVRGPVG